MAGTIRVEADRIVIHKTHDWPQCSAYTESMMARCGKPASVGVGGDSGGVKDGASERWYWRCDEHTTTMPFKPIERQTDNCLIAERTGTDTVRVTLPFIVHKEANGEHYLLLSDRELLASAEALRIVACEFGD